MQTLIKNLICGFTFLWMGEIVVSQTASEILNKKNRVFEPPPKSLKANSEDKEFRIKTEAKRVEEGLKSFPVGDPETNSESQEGATTSTSTKTLRSKLKNRDAIRRGYGFSGERVFGLGFVGAGAYGIFAGEIDVAVNDDLSLGAGLGTGMSYSSWGLYARFYMKQSTLSSFFQAGYANWYMGKAPESAEDLAPYYLTKRFFVSETGRLPQSLRIHLLYPAMGVLYQHESGLAITGQLQYLINIQDFFGGLAGSLGFHYYF
jgi:hypothetical protein